MCRRARSKYHNEQGITRSLFSTREVMRKLGRAGCIFVYAKGSHHYHHHPISDRITSVPLHGGKDIGRGLLKKILKQAGLTVEEFIDL